MDVTQQRTTVDALLATKGKMAPLSRAQVPNMDFISSLTGDCAAFRLLQSPELVKLNGAVFLVSRDIWGFAGPDPRSFPKRLIDCFQFTGNLFYQNVKRYAMEADRIYLDAQTKNKFFPEAPLSQEQAWSAWLLADAAQEAISTQDCKRFHREQTLVDALLLRFRNITELAQLANGNEIKEVTAAQTFQLKVETAGLIRAAEDLMSLTRELKEMWLFGPLRQLNEGEAKANDKMKENARAVADLLDELTKKSENQKSAPEEMDEKSHAAMDEEEEDNDE